MSSINENQIKKWLEQGVINEAQAQKMIADVTETRKETTSNKLIVTISVIGSVLLGIGAILFMASNWQVIPDIQKVLLLVLSTFGAYYLGYLFKYQYNNLPKVGGSLIFLGSLLFGASVFLIAQIYHVNANNHTLVLIWIAGILPLVYAFYSTPVASLTSILAFIWMGLFIFRNFTFFDAWEDVFAFPVLYLICAILLFGVGGLHYHYGNFQKVGRIYRFTSLKVAMISLFLLTFKFFSGNYDQYFNIYEAFGKISLQFTGGIAVLGLLTIIVIIAKGVLDSSESKLIRVENYVSLGLTLFALLFFFVPSTSNIYNISFNLIFPAMTLFLVYVGFIREDSKPVSIGMSWFSVFILAKYFDFFWDLLPRSMFFMVGGLILVGGGIFFEQKRSQIKQQFKKPSLEV